jgi:hypothetical protein
MKIFLLDIWHDLREKRLWPVAAVLALALVAVPVVLSKPAEEEPAADTASPVRRAPDPKELKGLASVKLDESASDAGSSLDTFDPGDPFRPPQAIVKRSREEDSSASATVQAQTDSSGSGSTGSSGDVSGGNLDTGSGSTGGDTGGGYTGGTGGGTGGDGTGGDGTGGGGSGGGGGTTTITQYAYVIDVTFTANGHKRRIDGMHRLDMLPSEAKPMLLFLGVSQDAGSAVFLVDSSLEAAGEGKCKPSADDCAFLYLGAGSEHEFTNEDSDSYTLRIDEIRKVKVGSTASSSKTKTAKAAVGAPDAPRRFVPRMLTDLVSVSSDGRDDSNSDRDRR